MKKLGSILLLLLIFIGCGNDSKPSKEIPFKPNNKTGLNKLECVYHGPANVLEEPHPAVIVLGGSEGGLASAAGWANSLAYENNIGALGVAYFNYKELPQNLALIELEYVAQAIDSLRSIPSVDTNKIGIVGASKGAELALLMASIYPEIKFVIGFSPSNVVFQGINADWSGSDYSSWQYQSKPVKYLPYAPYTEARATTIASLYEATLTRLNEFPESIIEVENINGSVLIFSGGNDKIWPSAWMSEKIIERLDSFSFKFPYTHHNFPNAGHTLAYINRDTTFGGTANANFQASKKANRIVYDFINEL